jgi:hypothetical protein
MHLNAVLLPHPLARDWPAMFVTSTIVTRISAAVQAAQFDCRKAIPSSCK